MRMCNVLICQIVTRKKATVEQSAKAERDEEGEDGDEGICDGIKQRIGGRPPHTMVIRDGWIWRMQASVFSRTECWGARWDDHPER